MLAFETFIRLLASRVGQIVNYSSLAGDVGVSSMTIKEWISMLEASYIVFTLRPYHKNYGKRLTKSPKIYFTETGLVTALLGIIDEAIKDCCVIRIGGDGQIVICRAESPRNSEPDRATLSIAQGVSPGYGVVIRPEPRQLAGWQIRMSVPFMLSIDYLHINAHPYLPPTRSARGSVTIFTLPQGLRPGLLNLPPRQ